MLFQTSQKNAPIYPFYISVDMDSCSIKFSDKRKQLQNLKSKPELNGQKERITGKSDNDGTERFHIQLDGHRKSSLKIKATNLKSVHVQKPKNLFGSLYDDVSETTTVDEQKQSMSRVNEPKFVQTLSEVS